MRTNAMPLLAAVGIGVAIGLYFTGSITSVLPLLFVLACPLMMIFMMKGMAHGVGHGRHEPEHQDRDATNGRRPC